MYKAYFWTSCNLNKGIQLNVYVHMYTPQYYTAELLTTCNVLLLFNGFILNLDKVVFNFATYSQLCILGMLLKCEGV